MSPFSVHSQRLRKNFARIPQIAGIPNLIEIQKQSYDRFLQADVPPEAREDIGLQGVFRSVFPIKDFSDTASLEFIKYTLGEEKYNVEECLQKGVTYAVPLKITVQLIVWDVDPDTSSRTIRDVKEQEVYFGEIPIMTENGTFIINGTERVIVSQLHRSPGIFFDHDKGKTHASGKLLYSARIIPLRGSWIDFEFDPKDRLYVRIDRRRKLPVTVFLKALGYSSEEILNYFYNRQTIIILPDGLRRKVDLKLLVGTSAPTDIYVEGSEDVLVRKNKKITRAALKRLGDRNITPLTMKREDLAGKVIAHDIIDESTGEVVAPCNKEISHDEAEQFIEDLTKRGITSFDALFIEERIVSSSLRDTLLEDKIDDRPNRVIEDYHKQHLDDSTSNETLNAQIEIYRRLRPSNPATVEISNTFFSNLFFRTEYYDLSRVGRLKLNRKLAISSDDAPLSLRTLRNEDIMLSVKYLLELKEGRAGREIDDIDHMGNRRVRSVGELLENQYRIGLVRMERAIKERMSLQDVETLMPHDLINAKPVTAVVKEFFGSSQLSQFMDQTNPLSEITHKRRLSALGPGGLTRERAGFEVRDVHPTHYGRICPIETPEGPNIGLIVSLSTYARVNEFGFIETPYRPVMDSKVGKQIRFLTALDEEGHVIVQANALLDEEGRLASDLVSVRHKEGEFALVGSSEADLMDVSPNQLVSVAASLIPFLENDDANRALMGSNMQRQAVPLLTTQAPLVGTGMEEVVATDSGVTVVAKRDGVVDSVDATRIVIKATDFNEGDLDPGVDIYNLIKYQRSNQNTCINQKPTVKRGDRVAKGQVVADGPATDKGELALGRNVLVAFMAWGGYNYEDSILVSEKIVKEDIFTSIHIEEFEVMARDTKLGKEEITRDIPNVGEEALRNLDDSGVIRIGAEVKPGDILVGKITPKGENQLSPEEKLLRAIFGEKAGDVRDSSLRVPPGVEGTIIGARIFSRKGTDKDSRTISIENEEIAKLTKDRDDEMRIVEEGARERIRGMLLGKIVSSGLSDPVSNRVYAKKGDAISHEIMDAVPIDLLRDVSLKGDTVTEDEVVRILERLSDQKHFWKMHYDERISRLKKGDELPPGVIKLVKVYIAIKRKLSVGDKMAGRHGNKGVLSRILPEEDMPYFEDGTPVEIVLNPLGVPSRMNVGQILETHLGWAARGLGEAINKMLDENFSPDKLRERLFTIFESYEPDRRRKVHKIIEEMDEDQVKKFVASMDAGIPISTPVFDGARESEIKSLLESAGLPSTGQTQLFDGRTGEPFDTWVTVGIIYMMKLHHLVDDKIHARAIGPYSLVTQQPLGGKAQFGGQRLGEMEVWAMESYGAAYSLQEFLTVKSDDVTGRTRMYESIVKGTNVLEPGLPESFNVLVKEIKSLGLDVELLESEAVTAS
ncbi:MAG: DNA-directed RNA polymerase subunit beta [Desulfomonile tiedjei]|uniref:DNA-directed RNA polymerase subunit beta n=2 Tax=Desulfomonile tiedjei TaxID=2358 RepID=A0A9D6V442_9BACT|nr:DNA-directed RNA polymerase subunit beta [Desulfomonile tiedjei]